jgi:hypothetical protein
VLASSVHVPGLEVADGDELGRGLGVVDDARAAVGDAPVAARLRRARSASVGGSLNTEVAREATLAMNVATNIERAWIEVLELGAIGRPLRAGDLGAGRC